ncbi:substrate-binding domain-containing protein [Mesorhizobium sp. VK24D]|uniref:Substrate-binding domain-containing protein n=1 Tax=Mesorhizobium album TaxID=3072314 RepID=A0ABU4Y6J6_9HYPH|nr:substrate-binding domain-containing protein [Mesorhizobium sp. VK24D]MDX8482562.1 substrate-binding domain-containing protein [Mesorhizobium sp. VK24D]
MKKICKLGSLWSVVKVAACLAFATMAPVAQAQDASKLEGTIYFLTPNSQITRFEAYDKPGMEEALKQYAPNLKLVVLSADNDPSKQLEQAQAAVTQGAKAILLAPAVPNQSQAIVQVAHDASIPVVGYAYNSDNSDIDYYVTVPFEPIGEGVANFAIKSLGDSKKPLRIGLITGDPSFFFDREIVSGTEKVLKPLVDQGKVEIVCKTDNLLLSEENARVATDGCLQQAGGDVDAILVHNDSSANGTIASLSAQNLLGKVKVFGGYDSQAGTIQHLLSGGIENDMVPPYHAMADSAVRLIVALLEKTGDEKKMVNGTYKNGMKDVPAIFNENVFITRDNVKAELIDKGILTREEVCAGPAVSAAFCAK